MVYGLHLTVMLAIWAIFAISYNVVSGTAGLLSLAHGAFLAIGAYSSALIAGLGAPLPVAVVAGSLVASAPAVLTLLPAFAFHRELFLVGTFVVQFVVDDCLRNLGRLTGGPQGMPGIRTLPDGPATHALIAVVVLLATVACARKLSSSSLGARLRCLREDPRLAESLGIDVRLNRALAIAVSGSMAGLAGALMAHFFTYIDPTYFGLDVSVLVTVMLLIGGLDSIAGAILGAAVVTLLPEGLRWLGFPPVVAGALRQIVFGTALIAILVYRPRGVFGAFDFDDVAE